jgi:hypothetical protein
MASMKLAILLIAALLVGTFDCAASCAAIKCESSCHHDKKAPEACSHELVLDRAAPLQAPESAAALQTSGAATIALSPETHTCNRLVLQNPDRQGGETTTPPLRI